MTVHSPHITTIQGPSIRNSMIPLPNQTQGCEYSVAADVLAEDPEFFHHVQQFAVEVHFSKKWCKAHEELSSFVTLLELLSEAGLELIEVMVTPCAPSDQASGLVPELESRAKKMRLEEGHCHNYLFARLDSKSA